MCSYISFLCYFLTEMAIFLCYFLQKIRKCPIGQLCCFWIAVVLTLQRQYTDLGKSPRCYGKVSILIGVSVPVALSEKWILVYEQDVCPKYAILRRCFVIFLDMKRVYSPTEEESSCKWEQSQVYLSYAECSQVSVNCSKRLVAWPFHIQMRIGYLCIRQKEINDQIYNSSITLR